MSSTGIGIDFNAQAILRKWPSPNNERVSASLGARPLSGRRGVARRVHPAVPVRHSAPPPRFTPRSKSLRAARPLHRQPTFLFWLQPMDVMVFSPRLSVRGTRGKGCQEEGKANGKRSRTNQLRIRFCGVKRFLSSHKSSAKLAQGNPARLASPDFGAAGTGLHKLLSSRRNSL
jgi:hypothetical protein